MQRTAASTKAAPTARSIAAVSACAARRGSRRQLLRPSPSLRCVVSRPCRLQQQPRSRVPTQTTSFNRPKLELTRGSGASGLVRYAGRQTLVLFLTDGHRALRGLFHLAAVKRRAAMEFAMPALRSLCFALSLVLSLTFAYAEEPAKSGAETDQKAAEKCEHGVKTTLCTRCNPKLEAVYKAKGDWCGEHNRPESQCVLCNSELAEKGVK